MDSYRQGNPYCVQIELTEGCNLRCPFCGLNGIRGKDNDYKYMTLETAMAIASDMSEFMWNSRIEFAMHGEPTMNPYLFEIIKTFRKMLPNSYLLMESNGGGLLRDPVRLIEKLFRSGLTTLALDEYQQVKLVEKIFAKLFPDPSPFWAMGISILRVPKCGIIQPLEKVATLINEIRKHDLFVFALLMSALAAPIPV